MAAENSSVKRSRRIVTFLLVAPLIFLLTYLLECVQFSRVSLGLNSLDAGVDASMACWNFAETGGGAKPHNFSLSSVELKNQKKLELGAFVGTLGLT